MKNLRRSNQRQADTLPDVLTTPDFEQLYRRYVDKVFRTCLAITKDNDSAKDYTQDIFLKAFEKLDSFKNRSSLSTWMYAISHNHCLTQLKQDSRRKTESITDGSQVYLLANETSGLSSEEAGLEQIQLAALQKLPPEELTLLRLKYEQGLSIRQISQQCTLSESAVKMRLKRSRDRLIRTINQQAIPLTPT